MQPATPSRELASLVKGKWAPPAILHVGLRSSHVLLRAEPDWSASSSASMLATRPAGERNKLRRRRVRYAEKKKSKETKAKGKAEDNQGEKKREARKRKRQGSGSGEQEQFAEA